MKDMRAVRFNEKVKRLSTIVGGFGVAFAVTSFTRWADAGLEPATWAWLLTSIALIFMSIQMNEMLESEDAE